MPLGTIKPKRRIVVVVGSLDVGGVEMDIVRNFPRLDRDRFDVRVYAFVAPGELAPRLEREGIKVVLSHQARRAAAAPTGAVQTGAAHTIGPTRQRTRAILAPLRRVAVINRAHQLAGHAHYLARAALPLAWYLARHRIDVVHCFLPHAYLVGASAAAAVPGVRLVMSRVSSNFYMNEPNYYRFAETRLAHRFLDAAVCNADAIRRDLIDEGIPQERITIIRNGIDITPFHDCRERRDVERARLGLAASQLALTAVANLHAYKGHADLIEGLAHIASRLPRDWRLLCAGRDVDGNLTDLGRLASRLGIGDNVRFLGSVSDIPALLAASDIHAHPSHEEGFPNSLLEAMAAGLPIVATNVGGIPELVIDGSNGLLVPPHDPTALGAAVLRLAGEPALRQQMAQVNMRRASDRFSLDSSVTAYESLYERLTKRR